MPRIDATGHPSHRELTVEADGVRLAGSLWLPPDEPLAVLLMHPGSGPSDRDNDVYFPPIREHLLSAGIGVNSFDKRGVGGSTGRWEDAGIVEQAADLAACLEALLADPAFDAPVGIYGHSQGGWVVVEAAGGSAPAAFVVANSGPGVTPVEQERFSHRTYLAAHGVTDDEMDDAFEPFDELVDALWKGTAYEAVRKRFESEQLPTVYGERKLVLFPDDEELWSFLLRVFDYDPRHALERIRVPLLALFGAEDTIVPVDASVAVYEEAVRPELLTVAVLAEGDHRLQTGDPPAFVDGYLDTLSSFIVSAATPARV
jgi:uncharacterized protein